MQAQMMVLVCAAAAAMQLATAAPQFRTSPPIGGGNFGPEIRILSEEFEMDEQGNYRYSYEQDNGQRAEQQGQTQPGPEPETGSIAMTGSYEFVGDDGNTYQVSYRADEGGFQPQAAHLPVAPAQIPEYAELRSAYPQLFWAEGQLPVNNPNNLRFFNN